MFEPVIGLEIHLALKTRTKMFCGCAADSFGQGPNVSTCPVCLGLPGSLPTINHEAIEKALMFSLALNCDVPVITQFHRKNYYYPDAPKNYQISQYDRPVGEHGQVTLTGGRTIGITRCHVEEDAGRLVHPTYAEYSLVDLNRAGAPLIEMVTEPDLRTPDEAREFLTKIRAIAQALGISDANPEEGKMRADVNVSVRRPGEGFGTKVEVKNLNSFKSVQRSLEFEIKRQSRVLGDGGRISQDTLGWDEGGQKTFLMRTKEGAADYRYFPDPDLPPMTITRSWLEQIRAKTPELPDAKRDRYITLGMREYDANIIAFDAALSGFFDQALSRYQGAPQNLANWLNTDVTGWLNAQNQSITASALTPEHLVSLLTLLDADQVSGRVAKEILPEVMTGANPETLVEARGLRQITDTSAIETVVDDVIARNPKVVEQLAANPKAVNSLLGQVMRETQGKAKPEVVRAFLNRKLNLTEV
jgi:aspartyl-tRNA(Asn)/glutamyl-tRNA(Gln) amidotransferase subunit B